VDEVTQEELHRAFPHGVIVAQEGERPNFEMVDVEVGEDQGKTVVIGWALPMKDMVFYPEDIMVREDGDWVFHSEGRRFRFAPLSAEQEKAIKTTMKEF